MTLRTVLLSLQALLAAAEPDDPQDAVVANQVGPRVSLCFSCLIVLSHFSSMSSTNLDITVMWFWEMCYARKAFNLDQVNLFLCMTALCLFLRCTYVSWSMLSNIQGSASKGKVVREGSSLLACFPSLKR